MQSYIMQKCNTAYFDNGHDNGSIFNRGLTGIDAANHVGIEFWTSVIGIQSVHFLLHVVQLGITKTEHHRMIQQHIR